MKPSMSRDYMGLPEGQVGKKKSTARFLVPVRFPRLLRLAVHRWRQLNRRVETRNDSRRRSNRVQQTAGVVPHAK